MTEGDIVYDTADDDANLVSNIELIRGVPTGTIVWLVNHGWVKNAKQAQQFLLMVAGLAVIIAIVAQIVTAPPSRKPLTPSDPSWPRPAPRA